MSDGGCAGTLVKARVICAVNAGVGVAVGTVVAGVCVVFTGVVVVLVVWIVVGEVGTGVGVGSVVAGVCDTFARDTCSDGWGVPPSPALVDTGVPETEGAPAGVPATPHTAGNQKSAAITITTTMAAVTTPAATDLPVRTDEGRAGSLVPHWVQNFWDRSFVTAPQFGQVMRTML